MRRKIEKELIEWMNNKNKKPLVLLGVRQSGKSYIIDDFCKNNYKKYIKIDLLKQQDFIDIYNKSDNYEKRKQLLFYTYDVNLDDDNSVLFVDEVQKCPLFIQDLKLYCEEGLTNIIVAGSLLSITLRDMDESYPVGKTNLKLMYPMSFEEFLIATGNERFIEEIRKSFLSDTPCTFHKYLMELFYKYLFVGGMPEMVQNFVDNNQDISKSDFSILKDIQSDYQKDIAKHIKNDKDKLRAKNIYDNIAPQLMKENPKFMYAKFDNRDRKSDYISALDWLVTSRMVIRCNQLTKPEIPIKAFSDSNNYKLYLSDVGLLRSLVDIEAIDIFLEGDFTYKGVIVENYVALELLNQFDNLYYWTKKGDENNSKAEVDFVIQVLNNVIPIEVKASNNKAQSLNVYNETFRPKLMLKICNSDFGRVNNIKTIPLYATFLIKELLSDEYKI